MKLELGFKQNRRRIAQAWSSLVHVLDIASTHQQWAILLLVGGFKHFLLFTIYGIILPIDELIFFKMVKNHQPGLESMFNSYLQMLCP
jgi:hypothetical protein